MHRGRFFCAVLDLVEETPLLGVNLDVALVHSLLAQPAPSLDQLTAALTPFYLALAQPAGQEVLRAAGAREPVPPPEVKHHYQVTCD